MATQTPTDQSQHDQPDRRPPRPGTRDLYLIVTVGAAIALLALAIILFLNRDDYPDGDGVEPTTTSEAGVTSEPPPTEPNQPATTATTATSSTDQVTATTDAPTPSGPSTASTASTPASSTQPVVWPAPGSGTGFDTPADAARSFAVDLVGFADPVLGEFRAGDARSGEIELRPTSTGPVSTILLRQVGSDDSWSVIAVVSENIVITQPVAGGLVANPVVLAGQARAFEGHVDVRLYVHGQSGPIASGFVTGRGDGVLGPFDSSLEWSSSAAGTGIVVFSTSSADDGSMWDVAAVPVRFP